MIKIVHTVLPSVDQMDFIIEGMRNPLNSWNKMDTNLDSDLYSLENIEIGNNDLSLMKNLSTAGAEHRKFMRMMPVMIRITAPLYWWKEFDTYKVGTVSNSCSTMHKIHAKEFTLDDFSHEHLNENGIRCLEDTMDCLNVYRDLYLEHKNKDDWWQMIQLLPSSYNQTRNVYLTYENLCNIYKQRKNHKLDEWIVFCEWIKSLPYSDLITKI